jgi:hypothetical protein
MRNSKRLYGFLLGALTIEALCISSDNMSAKEANKTVLGVGTLSIAQFKDSGFKTQIAYGYRYHHHIPYTYSRYRNQYLFYPRYHQHYYHWYHN